jgi:hypothetical protein
VRISNLLIVAAVFVAASSAHPIGRSGNGRMASLEDHASTSIPPDFQILEPMANKGVKLTSRSIFLLHQPASFETRRFSSDFSIFAKFTRDEISAELTKNGWQRSSLPTDPCVDIYDITNNSVASRIIIWGPQTGFVFVGTSNPYSALAFYNMARDLTVDAGACGWK